MATHGNPKNPKFNCEICNFVSSHKNDYAKHCETIKHRVAKSAIIGNPKQPDKNSTSYSCGKCNKTFFSHSGLYRHKKTCAVEEPSITAVTLLEFMKTQQQTIQKQSEEITKQNNTSSQQNNDVYKLMMEICKTMQVNASTVNNTNNTDNTNAIQHSHNNNKTFNLQFFLNETCKNALNLNEFIQNVKVDFDDIERIGSLGYVNGIYDVIVRNLNALGVEKRPIHCTDAKRNTIYVKEDDAWTKENEHLSRIQFLVDCVQKANLKVLAKWREKYPSCLFSNSIYTDNYNRMSHELMGGSCNKFNMTAKDTKIIHKIAKFITINKSDPLITT